MLKIYLPNGQVLIYNQAFHLRFGSNENWSLYSGEGPEAQWIATIRADSGLVVEAQPPCKIENTQGDVLGFVADNVQSLGRNGNTQLLRRLKKELQAFNTKTGAWKVNNIRILKRQGRGYPAQGGKEMTKNITPRWVKRRQEEAAAYLRLGRFGCWMINKISLSLEGRGKGEGEKLEEKTQT